MSNDDRRQDFEEKFSELNEVRKEVLKLFLRGESDLAIFQDLENRKILQIKSESKDENEEEKKKKRAIRDHIREISSKLLPPRTTTEGQTNRRNQLFSEIAKYKPELICEAWSNFKIVLDCDLKNLSEADKKELKNQIYQLAHTYQLTILNIIPGSIIIEFEGSPEGFERIKALFDSGELTEIAGFPIQEISALAEQETQPTQLSQWLQGVFAPLWESVDGLFTPEQPRFAFRQRTEGVSRRKTIVFNELEDRQVELVATIIPVEMPRVKVMVQIVPSAGATHLPEGLHIQLVDESDAENPEGEVFEAQQNLEFNAEVGDAFSIIVEQGRYRVVERFIV